MVMWLLIHFCKLGNHSGYVVINSLLQMGKSRGYVVIKSHLQRWIHCGYVVINSHLQIGETQWLGGY